MQILPSLNTKQAFAGLKALSGLDAQSDQKQVEAFRSLFEAQLAKGTDDSLDSLDSTLFSDSNSSTTSGQSSRNAKGRTSLTALGILSSAAGNVTTDPKTTRMTREDFAQLKESLKKYGFTDKEIEDLEASVDSTEGLTWSGFMAVVQERILGGETVVDISVENKRQLQSLMGKLGFTTNESSQLIKELEQGNATAVWSQISSKIQGLSEDTTLTIDPAEGQALAQALGLSTDAQNRLTSFFAKFADTELTATDIRSALLAITAEVADKKSAQSQALDEVKELASQVFVAAQKRLFGQTLSDSREDQVSRKAMLAQEMAENISEGENVPATTAGAKSVADLAFASKDAASADQTQPAAKSASTGQNSQSGADSQGRSQGTPQGTPQGTSQGTSQDTTPQGASQEGGQGRGKSAADDRVPGEKAGIAQEKAATGSTDASAQAEEEASGTDAWDAFWGRIGVEGMAEETDAMPGDTLARTVSTLLSSDLAAEETVTGTVLSSGGTFDLGRLPQPETAQNANRYVSADVLRQVENGMLKNLGQGGHRLTLNLSPEDLGAVNVMLTVKDKDVQAVIKTDTAEAAKIIGDQLNRVRESLEQQGLKVSKLEVQTGLAGQDQAAWQGADRHNEARQQQEEAARVRTAMRLFSEEAASSMESDVLAARTDWSTRSEGVDLFA
ncbi:MAG: flagellar hook-length control protein FliK [Thermodesulfobacteriota bacterium]